MRLQAVETPSGLTFPSASLRRSLRRLVHASAFLLGAPAAARAQTAVPPAAVATQAPAGGPPPSATARADRRHALGDTYVRVALGASRHRSTISDGSRLHLDVRGEAVAAEAAVGAVVAPGLALAGEAGGHVVRGPTVTGGSALLAVERVTYTRLGGLVDWYPGALGGLHVQAGLALAGYRYRTSFGFGPEGGDRLSYDTSLEGTGWNVGAGYEFALNPRWGAGGLLKLDGAKVGGGGGSGPSATLLAASLLVSFTYN